jgi:hypothetical protein
MLEKTSRKSPYFLHPEGSGVLGSRKEELVNASGGEMHSSSIKETRKID